VSSEHWSGVRIEVSDCSSAEGWVQGRWESMVGGRGRGARYWGIGCREVGRVGISG
jgi:hypothetical protein